MKNSCICVLALLVATCIGGLYAAEASPKPNIIIILADDMGYGDCGANNPESKIATPNIDQLAKEGLRFTDAHSASVTCTASRYGLLTGINPARTGVRNTLLGQGRPIIAENEKTIATMLKDQGYITKMVGKWHLGFEMKKTGRRAEFDFSKPLAGGPMDRGFDSYFGIHSSPGAPPLFYIKGRNPVKEPTETTIHESERANGKKVKIRAAIAPGFVQEEVSPRLCEDVVGIIGDHAASKGNKPLFLYYPTPVPHAPHVPVKKFVGKSGAGLYGDFVMQLDDIVGQVNDVLKETGLDKNTILIFTSDNGAMWKESHIEKYNHRANGIFRGHKSNAWEGGHRVPFIIKWPGRIQASSVSKTTINHTDIFATIAELLGVDRDKSYPGSAEDSYSFLPALFKPAKRFSRPTMVNSMGCIRIDDWKLVATKRIQDIKVVDRSYFELYNLADDPSEQKDVSNENPERTDQLVGLYEKFVANRRLKEGAQ